MLAVALSVAACSSSPEAEPIAAAVDSGGTADARVACGLPGEAVECLCATGPGLGRCNADGRIDPCVCLGGADAGVAADARGDVAESSPEAAVDVGPEVAALDPREEIERALCLAGAPRLRWTATGCYDNGGLDLVYGFDCRFRFARDGKVRCMPTVGTTSGGYSDNACSVELTTWTTYPVPPYLMLGEAGVSTAVVGVFGSGSWYVKGATCVVQTVPYPYSVPVVGSVRVKDRLADSAFFASPL